MIVGLTAEEPPVELTLLGINDFHGRIDANTVNFAGTIEQLRDAASGPTLFLSAGDNIGASLFASSVAQDQPTIDVLNALELETSAVGNHEFDRGFDDLAGRVTDESDFSYLGANVYEAGTETPVLQEYELIEVDGLTVGVIGAVTEETPTLVSPAGITSLSFGDPVEAVNRVAAELSDGDESNGEADVLVATYHEGAGAGTPEGATLEKETAGDGAFAAIVEDTAAEVDAIFTGHTHKEYAWSAAIPGTDRTRPIVQTGSYGAKIGKITLTIDPETGDVLGHAQENVARTTTPAAELITTYPRVSAVNDIVTQALANAAEVGNTAVAQMSGDITTAYVGGSFVTGVWTGGSRDDRASESALGNLVAGSILDSLSALPNGAQIGVTNPGGLRADLFDTQAEFGASAVAGMPDGTISFSQANAVQPFNNTLALVTLTGEQFTTLLEQQWQRDAQGNVPSRPYLQLGLSDNVTYTFDPTLPEGSRITSVTIDGAPLDPAAEYRIGTASFLPDLHRRIGLRRHRPARLRGMDRLPRRGFAGRAVVRQAGRGRAGCPGVGCRRERGLVRRVGAEHDEPRHARDDVARGISRWPGADDRAGHGRFCDGHGYDPRGDSGRGIRPRPDVRHGNDRHGAAHDRAAGAARDEQDDAGRPAAAADQRSAARDPHRVRVGF